MLRSCPCLVYHRAGAALGPWARGALKRLANGPYVGTLVVAYWVLGSHNPYGFRARDVLKTERVRGEGVQCIWRQGWCGMGSRTCFTFAWCRSCGPSLYDCLTSRAPGCGDHQVDLRDLACLIVETDVQQHSPGGGEEAAAVAPQAPAGMIGGKPARPGVHALQVSP